MLTVKGTKEKFELQLEERIVTADQLYQLVSNAEGLCSNDFYLTCNGRRLSYDHEVSSSCIIRSNLRIHGGKGGFGSMLRSLGARIEKTTNHEACRDLSGRRMRDVNSEKQIADWLKDKEEREQDRSKKRQEKLERILNPKHKYEDKDYTSNLQQNADNIDEALRQALQNSKEKVGDKRRNLIAESGKGTIKKKVKMSWMGMDEDGISDDSDEGEEILPQPVEKESDGFAVRNKILIESTNETVEPTIASHVTKDDTADTSAVSDSIIKECTSGKETKSVKSQQTPTKPEALDLIEYNSAEQLEAVGLDRLKSALMYFGLKCGGTLQERAQRLYMTKDTSLDKLDPSLFAKTAKKKKSKLNNS